MAKIPGAIFPVDPTLGDDDAKYRYGVVVRVECGSSSGETLIFVDSDTILGAGEAIDMAIQDWAGADNQGPYSPPPPIGSIEECRYSGRVVSVGRRSDVPMFPGS